jgi:valyl-tRNA synthetase
MEFKDLPSQYDHEAAQKRWYPFWESRGYFHAEADDPRPPFTIVIPPPNVTGALHLGHALNNTLQDILIRMKRMQGFNTLWMPGTDHAGIATQAVVERRLFEEEKKTRHDLGREGLVARIWKWKDQYEARILSQLKQMGCSCDWVRTQFTFNEHNSRAVREWFFHLFKDGKIYRGKRLVNWDTFLQTAVSDDEVFHEPVKGHFWHFKYPVAAKDRRPGEPEFVTIATTRPETMLGDTAVAVHPDPAAAFDKVGAELREKLLHATVKEKAELEEQMTLLLDRRAKVLPQLEQLRDMAKRGVQLELPLTGRTIPLITDEWAKPELGSGAVKTTPAHDANDYEVWQRHSEIGAINILNPDGTLNENVPQKYRGLNVKKAREAVVADMEGAGLLVDVEDREIDLAHSDRSKTPIEPYLADQWFVKMHELAQTAIDAVTSGRVKIVPERYAKGYLDWLGEKRDWPIGRQLWWGHRVPVWIQTFVEDDASMKISIERADGIAQELPSLRINAPQLRNIEEWNENLVSWRSQNRISVFIPKADFQRRAAGDVALSICIADPENRDRDIVKYLESKGFFQDSDVLDTWFSSALWPHSTLGWPDDTPELKKFYPTSVLITSRDIITLWVARMVLAGLYNVGDVPFHEVYITPKILDGYGETMSKSKGNGVDPIDIIEKFGADALRFGLAHLTTDTQDVKLPVDFECPHCDAQFAQTKKNRQLPRVECEKCGKPFSTQWAEKPEDKDLPRGSVVSERFELGRNFANKLWNAARFSLINLEGYAAPGSAGGLSDDDLLLEDRWLLSRLATVTQQVTDALERYRYADTARTLYDFAWNEFCSFYVEMTKARFGHVAESLRDSDDPRVGDTRLRDRQTAQRVLAHALDVLMRLLHPMMPFLTEEVWQLLGKVAPTRDLSEPVAAATRTSASLVESPGSGTTQLTSESICIAPWPTADATRQDANIEQQFADFQAVLGAVREIRQTQNIPQREELTFSVRCDNATAHLLRPMQPYFTQMARATATEIGPEASAPAMAASRTLTGRQGPIDVHVDVSRFIDTNTERKQLEKNRDNLLKQIGSIESKLANKNFVEKAPVEVVDQQRAKLDELRGQLASVEAALKRL